MGVLPMSSVTLPAIRAGAFAPDMSGLTAGDASAVGAAWQVVAPRCDLLLSLALAACWQPRCTPCSRKATVSY
jgi:hypothetical protein